jgi:N utilization substance protein A
VGIKGSRVQAIIRELRGEKIDIVQWSDDASLFVANALNPAKVGRVTILDEQEKLLEVTVEDSQLSQAIGKKGQNVRLASQLIGWRIEIKSESDKKKEIEDEISRIARGAQEIRRLPGVGEKLASGLMEKGYQTLEDLVAASLDDILNVPGIGDATGEKLQEAAREAIAQREERLAREREEAEREAALQAEAAAAAAAKAEEEGTAEAGGEEPPAGGEASEEAAPAEETPRDQAEAASATAPAADTPGGADAPGETPDERTVEG